jgi:hypothetical protein
VLPHNQGAIRGNQGAALPHNQESVSSSARLISGKPLRHQANLSDQLNLSDIIEKTLTSGKTMQIR